VLGVGLTVLTDSARLDPIGALAGLAGTTCMGFGVVLTKRWGRPVSLLTMAGWQLTAGGLLLMSTALLAQGLPSTVDTENAAGYAYLSLVGGALVYALWCRGLERLPAAPVSLLGLLSPLLRSRRRLGRARPAAVTAPARRDGGSPRRCGRQADRAALPRNAAAGRPGGHVGAVVPQRRTQAVSTGVCQAPSCGHPSQRAQAAVERPAGSAGPPVHTIEACRPGSPMNIPATRSQPLWRSS
jgi:hypothetical protein